MRHTRKEQREARAKRKNIARTVLAGMGLLVFLLVVGRVGYWETHYCRNAQVTNVNNQLIEVTDSADLVWEFYGDGFRTGDKVRLYMFNNGTDSNIYDDEIEDVKLR